MLERQRKETILRLIDLHRFTSVHEVVEATGASESTIRRDFIDLEAEKKLLRVRGGVQRHSEFRPDELTSAQPSFDLRTTINQEKKRRIAKEAAALLRDGETIFIDGGTTTFQMVEYLSAFTLTVVTNSFAVANHLIRHTNCTVILPEGYHRSRITAHHEQSRPGSVPQLRGGEGIHGYSGNYKPPILPIPPRLSSRRNGR